MSPPPRWGRVRERVNVAISAMSVEIHLIKLSTILEQNSPLHRIGLVADAGFDGFVDIAVEAGDVREVGFEHDLVDADLVEKLVGNALLEPVAAIDLAVEILARHHLE